MRARLLMVMSAATLLVAACGDVPDAARVTTSPSIVPEAEAVLYTYSYEPGERYEYTFELDQTLDMSVAAEGSETFVGQDPPGDISLTTSIAGSLAYDIGAGPQPGTTEISVSGVFDTLEIAGTIDGEPFDESMVDDGTVPDLVEVPDLTLVVDAQGHLVSVAGEEVPADFPFFGDPFSQLGDFTSGGLDSHFGPAFPDEPLAVGGEWSYRHEEELEGLPEVVSTETTYRVVDTQQIGDREVTLIDFTTDVSGVEIDLGEMFQELLQAFAGSEAGGASNEAVEMPEMTFLIRVAPSSVTGTVWFDQKAGLVTRIAQDTATSITMLMDFSDDSSSMRTEVSMDLDMQLGAELIEGSNA